MKRKYSSKIFLDVAKNMNLIFIMIKKTIM